MTPLQRLQLRQSELREASNALLSQEETLSDEQNQALDKNTKELQALEPQLRAAIAASPDDDKETPTEDSESRELHKLETRASIGNYVAAAAELRPLDGIEKEYQEARKLSGNAFPLQLLARRAEPKLQTRATTDVDTTTRPQPWLDRIFAGTASEYLGLRMEEVESGAASHPVTTAGGTPAQRGRTQAATAAGVDGRGGNDRADTDERACRVLCGGCGPAPRSR